jgi:glycosyltransferase involved in cell wall biosynthesis
MLAAPSEVSRLERIAPRARVAVLPNGVDVDHFCPGGGPPEPATLLFSGNLSHRPNAEAVLAFARAVLPRLRARRPDLRWLIVGAHPGPLGRLVADDPGVELPGDVPDLRPFFERATVAISPLLSGGGIKIKVLEAWAMARPVVATPLGASGLAARPGENLLLARTPGDFAAAVLTVLGDQALASHLGALGRQTVLRHYRWEQQAARLDDILGSAVAEG